MMISEMTNTKSEICRLFAILFYNPEETFLQNQEIIESLAGLLIQQDKDFTEDAEILKNYLIDFDKTELMIDYASLFVGPYQLQAPPYGSVYLDTTKIINDESTAAVIEMYKQFGLEVDADMKEPADHIAIELEFIYSASNNIENVKALGGDTEEQSTNLEIFIDKYFKPFVSQMCSLMEKNASTDFYRTLGKLLSRYSETI